MHEGAAGMNVELYEKIWMWAAGFLIVLFLHAYLFGASPFPSGWVPF